MKQAIPFVYSLKEQTLDAIQKDVGTEAPAGREKEVGQWCDVLLKTGRKIDSNLFLFTCGFLHGYQMRGYDSIADFHIDRDEMLISIVETVQRLNDQLHEKDATSLISSLILASILSDEIEG